MDISLDLQDEFEGLRKSVTCQVCESLFEKPVYLRTCEHISCKEKCLNNKKKRCSVCKNSFNSIDVKDDDLTAKIIRSIQNIESIFIDIPKPESDNFELIVSKVSMKRNPKGETPMHLACKKGNLDKIKELMKSGVDFNMTEWANWSPLHEAVNNGHTRCVEYLASNGALLNIPGAFYITPLHKAIACNFLEIAKILVRHGGDLDALDYSGFKPLELAKSPIILGVTQEYEITPQVFLNNETVVYCQNLTRDEKFKLTKAKVKFANAQEFLAKDDVTHFIAENDKLKFDILIAILKGVFIVDKNWIPEYSKMPDRKSFNHIIKKYKSANEKSIRNKLVKNPKLFDGIHFYITDDEKPMRVYNVHFTKKDLTSIIRAGGGQVIVRPPALRTVEDSTCYPFHAKNNIDSRICANYIIYNEASQPELLYKMKELKHKSVRWLINSILEFQIID